MFQLMSSLTSAVRGIVAQPAKSLLSFNPLASQARFAHSKYKLKTHKGAAKRWLAVGDSREFKRMKVNKAHLNMGMSSSRFGRLSQMAEPEGKAMRRTLRRLMPYA
ncbi:ribosomal protein L35 [Allomyces macrogynus ATCC 38327]|uniref:Ribosomal protein L35 n=1 Tax=Allomyces macrogynus (strain ATCC 38327) TaxID=578462 RepID=A0A0L0S8P5_ALLM3|nr:hypothetical protein GGF31_001065 [Allomyces arbusculus]KNE58796.1 ribosomal protein L35 [Allomyces macrogynus ATCC 38327]|eukprot:KNE58796.1 ribosomal protein L35 [Allomyces macrogynus ATCC 38327]